MTEHARIGRPPLPEHIVRRRRASCNLRPCEAAGLKRYCAEYGISEAELLRAGLRLMLEHLDSLPESEWT